MTLAHEPRHWVRLSYRCNNRCAFCLDAAVVSVVDHVPADAARREIDAGLAAGATRLVLSGGEPTLHPDFLDLVRYGRQRGYRHVQAISNGRMFAYARFLAAALEAGLGEVTFSLPSHRPEVFEALTGVPGSHAQALAGLRSALASGRLIVSVDVVLTRLNTPDLPATVAAFADLGVREVDLLHLVPFGRAYDAVAGAVPLAVDPVVEQRALAETFALAADRGLVVWTNRVPPALLEGHEAFFQDPHKLVDEVRGRREHLDRLVDQGDPLPCFPDRCGACALDAFCAHLHATRAALAARRVPALRVSWVAGETPRPVPGELIPGLERLCLRAPDAAAARSYVAPGVPERWELEAIGRAGRRPAPVPGRQLIEVVVSRPAQIAPARALGARAVILRLDATTAEWVRRHLDALPDGLGFELAWPGQYPGAAAPAPDLHDRLLADLAQRGRPVAGLPPCLGGPDMAPVDDLDLAAIGPDLRLDPGLLVADHVAARDRAFSLRCGECLDRQGCPGLPVAIARAQGLAVLRPRR
jgi:pyruvate-formate lyase-activating enzyme